MNNTAPKPFKPKEPSVELAYLRQQIRKLEAEFEALKSYVYMSGKKKDGTP